MARIDGTGVDLRRLRYFVAVCEYGGFSRAAGAVGIAQPALTRQIKLLEHDLGFNLFTRNGRSATPTEMGAALLKQSRRHLDELDLGIDRLRRTYAAAPRRVTLGICPTISPLFLDHVTEAAKALPGGPRLSVIEAYSGDLSSLMQAGRLDFALSYMPADATGLKVTPLLGERLVVASRQGGNGRIGLEALPGLRLILPHRIHQLRQIIDRVLQARGIVLTPALELDSLSAVKAMLAGEGGGHATILPFHSVAEDAAAGRLALRLIDDPDMVRTIALLCPAQGVDPLPDLARQIADHARTLRQTLEAVF